MVPARRCERPHAAAGNVAPGPHGSKLGVAPMSRGRAGLQECRSAVGLIQKRRGLWTGALTSSHCRGAGLSAKQERENQASALNKFKSPERGVRRPQHRKRRQGTRAARWLPPPLIAARRCGDGAIMESPSRLLRCPAMPYSGEQGQSFGYQPEIAQGLLEKPVGPAPSKPVGGSGPT